MTLLAWIVVLVLHSLLSLVVMMCNCHLPQCLVHGSSQRLPRSCYFQLLGTWPELTRGNFARPPWPGSPPLRPGSYFSPQELASRTPDLTSATRVGVLVRCSPTGRSNSAFVRQRTAYQNFGNFHLWGKGWGALNSSVSKCVRGKGLEKVPIPLLYALQLPNPLHPAL